MKITKPATIAALLKGDIENAIIAEMSGGIEAQEAQGQKDLVESTMLPRKCGYGTTREMLEDAGITFGADVDDLFVDATLPEGWRKVATDHSMHSEIVDSEGRRRARIFYKAAFYDQRADITLCHRFSTRTEPVCGYDDPNYRSSPVHCIVTDCDEVVWTSDTIEPRPEGASRDEWMAWSHKEEVLRKTGVSWLNEHYPDWDDPLAYWD